MTELWNGLLSGLGSIISFLYDVIPSYGIAIILLTVFVRVLLLPLTLKQTRSMHAMQQIQPKVKELQKKHKGDRQKLNQELMKLYQEHQVNPLGGCLPLLLQLPVFFALFQVLRGVAAGQVPGTRYLPDGALKSAIESGSERFLSMNLACSPSQAGDGVISLVAGAPPSNCGTGLGAQIPFYIMVALMVGTTYYQQKQMQRNATGPQAQQMRIMTTVMPAILGFFSISIPAGVLVYWVTTNAWQVGQQAIMLRKREEATVSGGKSPPDKPAPKPSTGSSGNGSSNKGSSNARNRKKRRKR